MTPIGVRNVDDEKKRDSRLTGVRPYIFFLRAAQPPADRVSDKGVFLGMREHRPFVGMENEGTATVRGGAIWRP